jgi:hypothetical protein
MSAIAGRRLWRGRGELIGLIRPAEEALDVLLSAGRPFVEQRITPEGR